MVKTVCVRSDAKPLAKPRLYYGYVTVIITGLILMLSIGLQTTFGVFFKPMLAEFGWTRAVTSVGFSTLAVTFGISSIIAGKLTDRFSPRAIISAGGLLCGIGVMLTSFIDSLWQFYLFYGVFAGIGAGFIFVPLATNVTRWFTRRREIMMGIALSGTGIGNAVAPPIAGALLVSSGWRFPMLLMGAVSLVGMVTLAQFLKRKPEPNGAAELELPDSVTSVGLSARQALRTNQLWLLAITWLLYGFFQSASMVHIVPHATDIGMSPPAAATVVTVIGLVGAVGRFMLGITGNRSGTKVTLLACFALLSAAYWGLAAVSSPWMLYLFGVIFGLLSGLGIFLSVIIASVYGLKELGVILGLISFANALGSAVGPVVTGYIYDTTQAYHWAFIIFALTSGACAVIYSFFKPLKRPGQGF